jgi:putative PIN family toxin of toxin-antitoxin system
MIRAVLDTNVLVSAVIRRDGKPSQIVSRALFEFSWLTSEYILAELADVLNRKHIQTRYGKWLTAEVQNQFLARTRATVEIIDVQTTLTAVPEDVKDNPVLACAVDGQADYLVTGDPDLLTLKEFHAIKIVAPNRFLQILDTSVTEH